MNDYIEKLISESYETATRLNDTLLIEGMKKRFGSIKRYRKKENEKEKIRSYKVMARLMIHFESSKENAKAIFDLTEGRTPAMKDLSEQFNIFEEK